MLPLIIARKKDLQEFVGVKETGENTCIVFVFVVRMNGWRHV
jgi:hypothetical protein